MSLNEVKDLCDQIRETSFAIHCYFRNGFHEKIYENALVNRLTKQGVAVEQQVPVAVHDEDGTLLGDFKLDLLVEKKLVVEAKACRELTNEHIAQLLGYMRACNIEDGLLINFGGRKLQIRKFILTQELGEA